MINFENYSSSRISLNNMYTEHKTLIYSWFSEKYEIDLDIYPDINKPNIIKYIMINNIDLKCICGKIKRWNRNRFLTTCGDKNCTNQTRCDTNIKKYGGNSPMSSKEICDKISKQYQSKTQDEKNNIKNKRILTNNNKYGGNAPIHDENVKNKIKQSCISRFGVDNFSKVSDFKNLVSNKISETKAQNFKSINANNNMLIIKEMLLEYLQINHHSTEFIEQNNEYISKNLFNIYNRHDFTITQKRELILNYPFNMKCINPVCEHNKKWIRNKYAKTCCSKDCLKYARESTCLNKYGVNNYFKHESLIMKNIGVNNIQRLNNNIINFEKLNPIDFTKRFIDVNGYLLIREAMLFYNYKTDTPIYKFIKQNNIVYKFSHNRSGVEKKIEEFLQSKVSNIQIEQNIKSLLNISEIDIYLPESNTGIEYNGLYWHSYGKEDSNIDPRQNNKAFQSTRHLKKTEAFEALSTSNQLFHIFENEWEDVQKQDIWKSIISNRLGMFNQRIHARKCIIKEITSKEANKFILDNHIQGIRNAKYKIGLFYNLELVSVMTFGSDLNNKESKDDSYELIRFCNKKYTVIPGAASKLLKYFETKYNPKSITSYANRRWSKGDLYHKLGFELINISKPNKFIIKHKKLYNRIAFQKHKLEETLESFNNQLSADENCINNGYRIIWDSGNYVFKKEY